MYTFKGKDSGKFFVIVLKLAQNIGVLKPCCPKKGPTGGKRLAVRAGIVKQTHQSKDFLVLEESNNRATKLLAICSLNIFEYLLHLATKNDLLETDRLVLNNFFLLKIIFRILFYYKNEEEGNRTLNINFGG